MSEYIEIKNVEFSYDKSPILQDVNAKIKKGEFIGIFGPNGGGKTTFLKLLMGFLKPKKGSISLFGRPPKAARSEIGYVPQAMHFDKQFPVSVLDVVLMGCLHEASWCGTFSSETKEKAHEALKWVGLADKHARAFGTLSGGQAQRVLIARALACRPSLLLLDEPTANIDAQAEQEIYEILMKLKGEMTILMVTHDLKAILEKVDQSFCIHRILTSFLPKDLCGHFSLGLYHPPIVNQPFGKK